MDAASDRLLWAALLFLVVNSIDDLDMLPCGLCLMALDQTVAHHFCGGYCFGVVAIVDLETACLGMACIKSAFSLDVAVVGETSELALVFCCCMLHSCIRYILRFVELLVCILAFVVDHLWLSV